MRLGTRCRLVIASATVVAGVLLALDAAHGAHAQSAACDNTSLSGSYGFMDTGVMFLGQNNAPQAGGTRTDYADVGIFQADGAGNISFTDTVSVGGKISQGSGSGTYAIRDDCTGTVTLNFANGQTGHLQLALTNGGAGGHAVLTDPGTAVTGVFEQTGGPCSNDQSSGDFAYVFTGVALPPATPQGVTRLDIAAVGAITVDAAGNVSYADIETAGGRIVPRNGDGVQTVGADCNGTGTINLPGGNVGHTAFVVVDGGRTTYIILTDAGSVLTGVSELQ